MRVYKTRWFNRWAKKAGLSDRALLAAVDEMERGLVGDALGGFVFKKRVAFPGGGKRGGSRALIVYKKADRAFFVFGFRKSRRSTIVPHELHDMRLLARHYLSYTPEELDAALAARELIEVSQDG
ncbi:MAG: type II toxin-antitoxin system RelE/ParE family toxin [Gammaproteobacteria bacterium]|nr:type II toxin-antitoxin system RelE/ParE family toxin [Gammaproteobacteria bacterium]